MSVEPALARPRQWQAGMRSLERAAASITSLWHLWRQRCVERRLAAQFTARDLRELGLTHADIYREFVRPFWRRPTDP